MAHCLRRSGLACIKVHRTIAQYISDTARSKRHPTQSVHTSTPVTGHRACGSKQASDDSILTVSRCRIPPVRPDLSQQIVDSDATRLNKVFSVHTCFQSPGPPQSHHSIVQEKRYAFFYHSLASRYPECSVPYSARGSTL
jgi:hypothetical protein